MNLLIFALCNMSNMKYLVFGVKIATKLLYVLFGVRYLCTIYVSIFIFLVKMWIFMTM